MPRYASSTTAIEKICKVLICMTDPEVKRLKDVIEKTGLDKASAIRMLECLTDYGLVERDESTKEYRYGPQQYVIASSLKPRIDLAKIAEPSLHRLAKLSGDSVQLLVRQGLESVCVAMEVGDWHIRAGTLHVGSRRPLGHGAGSLALIAWLGDIEVEFVLSALADETQAHPYLDLQYLRREIKAARTREHTLMLDTIMQGVGAVGVPIRDRLGAVVGAISISSITQRVSDREHLLAGAIRKETVTIAEAIELYQDS